MSKDDTEGAKVSIEDFVSVHKLTAFVNTYLPVDADNLPGVEVFNEARLRKYFQAFPRTIGDPLNWYLDGLARNKFPMRTSSQGEPAIFVRRRAEAHETALMEAMFDREAPLLIEDNENEE
jgi:hypothetical protein